MALPARTRVVIVDDSLVARKLLGDALRTHDDLEVVGGAADPCEAWEMILQHKPDVITLDIEMPRMDGLSFLRKLREHHPIPAVIVSSLTQSGSAAGIEALRMGAIDVIGKPGDPMAVAQVAERVAERIRALRQRPIGLTRRVPAPPPAGGGRAPRLGGERPRPHRGGRLDGRHPGHPKRSSRGCRSTWRPAATTWSSMAPASSCARGSRRGRPCTISGRPWT
jgi:two-component system chemotaxis response regulator CheB